MVKKRKTDSHISKKLIHHEHSPGLPAGIKVLLTYVGVVAAFYLIYLLLGFTKPVSIIFGQYITGMPAMIVEFTSLALLFVIMFGLIKKYYWVFWVSFLWFLISTINAIVSLFIFKAEFDVLKSALIASSLIVIVLNGIIAWYIYSEKHYFKVKHMNKETKTKDKFFVYLISVFLIVSFLVLITFGIDFYNTTIKTTNKVISELNQAAMPDLFCAQKDASEKDICYLVLSIVREGKESKLCENIGSDFYKMTCYRTIQ
jgi:hypothetical protein